MRSGITVQAGSPREVCNNPANAFAAGFLGEANNLDGRMEEHCLRPSDGSAIPLPAGSVDADAFAVRPEKIPISSSEPSNGNLARLYATLRQRIFAGEMAICIVDVNAQTVKVIARDRDIPERPDGAQVLLRWNPEDTILIARSRT
ncbi:MAG: TOBE domain-containing protein [Rhodospirillaceae bacterium]|nr:TOBE domain-containing protein [Rhodospirillaceae bacterium]